MLTAKSGYGLSSSAYGAMFVPQVVLAILAAFAGGFLARRFRSTRVLLAGIAANLLSMLVLLASALAQQTPAAYPMLLVATAALGAGFGLAVPVLNSLAAALHPHAVDRSALILNALLGAGTALAPIAVAVFTALGAWWVLPVVTAVALVVLGIGTLRLHEPSGSPTADAAQRPSGSRRLLVLFGAAALLYGIIETLSGNWSQTTVSRETSASGALASAALAAFWAAVTLGRILFAVLQSRLGSTLVYRVLPFVVAAAYIAVLALRPGGAALGIVLFALAGFGCSALWPLTLSLGQERVAPTALGVTGPLTALYQAGYGIAAFGTGGILDLGVSPAAVFVGGAVVAVALAVVGFALTRGSGSARSRGAAAG